MSGMATADTFVRADACNAEGTDARQALRGEDDGHASGDAIEGEDFFAFARREVSAAIASDVIGPIGPAERPATVHALDADGALHATHGIGGCRRPLGRADERRGAVSCSSLVYPPVVLRHILHPPPRHARLGSYGLPEDGEDILARIARTGLRDRCGARDVADRWREARQDGRQHVVVASTLEDGSAAYVDRLLLEEDPHTVLAGLLAAGRAVGASRGVVRVREGFEDARRAVEEAIDEARLAGCLGDEFDVSVASGGDVGLPDTDRGITRGDRRGAPGVRPSVVHCIETLAVVPWAVRSRARCGTRAISLAGAVQRPGLVEVALGTPLLRVLDEGGRGAPPGARWKMALVGGPNGRIIPRTAFGTRLSPDTLPGLGHGGIVVLAEDVPTRDVARHLLRHAGPSSGPCGPCRAAGTSQLSEAASLRALARLLESLEMSSPQELGPVSRPIHDLLTHFGDELFC